MTIARVAQGKAVCVKDGRGWLVSLPDGHVCWVPTRKRATQCATAWAAQDMKLHHPPTAIGTLTIEWRPK